MSELLIILQQNSNQSDGILNYILKIIVSVIAILGPIIGCFIFFYFRRQILNRNQRLKEKDKNIENQIRDNNQFIPDNIVDDSIHFCGQDNLLVFAPDNNISRKLALLYSEKRFNSYTFINCADYNHSKIIEFILRILKKLQIYNHNNSVFNSIIHTIELKYEVKKEDVEVSDITDLIIKNCNESKTGIILLDFHYLDISKEDYKFSYFFKGLNSLVCVVDENEKSPIEYEFLSDCIKFYKIPIQDNIIHTINMTNSIEKDIEYLGEKYHKYKSYIYNFDDNNKFEMLFSDMVRKLFNHSYRLTYGEYGQNDKLLKWVGSTSTSKSIENYTSFKKKRINQIYKRIKKLTISEKNLLWLITNIPLAIYKPDLFDFCNKKNIDEDILDKLYKNGLITFTGRVLYNNFFIEAKLIRKEANSFKKDYLLELFFDEKTKKEYYKQKELIWKTNTTYQDGTIHSIDKKITQFYNKIPDFVKNLLLYYTLKNRFIEQEGVYSNEYVKEAA